MQIGRNDHCICESGKKYKYCYGKQNPACLLFDKEQKQKFLKEHDIKEKEVVRALNKDFINDLNQLFYKIEDDREVVPERIQLIGIFTMIDVLASYWYEYLGKSGTQKERFHDYVKNFCLLADNEEYQSNKYICSIDSEKLYRLRSGLVHFYGIAVEDFAIAPNFSKKVSVEFIEESYQKFKKLFPALVFIQPFELKKIVVVSAILMIEKMKKNIHLSAQDESKKWEHIYGIDRIFNKLQKEGAKKMPLLPIN